MAAAVHGGRASRRSRSGATVRRGAASGACAISPTGRSNVVFTVDLFNEGVDVPTSTRCCCCARPRARRSSCSSSAEGCARRTGRRLHGARLRRQSSQGVPLRPALPGAARRVARRRRAPGRARLPVPAGRLPHGARPGRAGDRPRSIRDAIPSDWRESPRRARRSLGDVDARRRTSTRPGLELEDIYASEPQLVGAAPSRGACNRSRQARRGRAAAGGRPAAARRRPRADRRLPSALQRPTSPPRLRRRMTERERRLAPDARRVAHDPVSARQASTTRSRELVGAPAGARASCCELLDLLAATASTTSHAAARLADVPLRLHARYTRTEILAAFGIGDGAKPPDLADGRVRGTEARRPTSSPSRSTRRAASFSPTTRYRDYAISPELIHWESQSATSRRQRDGPAVHQPRRATARTSCSSPGSTRTTAPSGASGRPRTSATRATSDRVPGGCIIGCPPTSTRRSPRSQPNSSLATR